MVLIITPAFQVLAGGTPGKPQVGSSKDSFSTNESVVLNWSETQNTDHYGLTVRRAPYKGDSTIVFDSFVNGTSIDIGTLPEGSYRFAMYAYNSEGTHGALSNIYYFKVIKESVGTPGKPDVWSAKDPFSTDESIVLNWSETQNADHYGLTVRRAPYKGDSTIVFDSFVNGTSIDIGRLPEGSYRFAMYAYNSEGTHGTLSDLCYFNVVNNNNSNNGSLKARDMNSSYYYSPLNPFGRGWCTWYAFGRAAEVNNLTWDSFHINGNASNWLNSAKSLGWSYGTEPRANSIYVSESKNHVAFVEAVNSDGTISISEGGWGGQNVNVHVDEHVNPSNRAVSGYIYFD